MTAPYRVRFMTALDVLREKRLEILYCLNELRCVCGRGVLTDAEDEMLAGIEVRVGLEVGHA